MLEARISTCRCLFLVSSGTQVIPVSRWRDWWEMTMTLRENSGLVDMIIRQVHSVVWIAETSYISYSRLQSQFLCHWQQSCHVSSNISTCYIVIVIRRLPNWEWKTILCETIFSVQFYNIEQKHKFNSGYFKCTMLQFGNPFFGAVDMIFHMHDWLFLNHNSRDPLQTVPPLHRTDFVSKWMVCAHLSDVVF